ncbi:UNVERIFIED_CONTAM: hypothetical protein Sindi_2904500 [Sesamum indicum]
MIDIRFLRPWARHLVTEDETNSLLSPFTPSDVKEAVFDIAEDKAPGPDGYSSGFFKAAWPIVEGEVTRAVLDFFTTGRLLKQINTTILALIPKVHSPMSVGDFRPISCCNVLYKIIAKLIVKRLSMVLDKVISPCQAAFVPSRSIVDNIMLAQELFSGYNQSRLPPRCALKVDIRKAWIEECVTTPSFSIGLNGKPHGFFLSARGLRQGDPLSPYLFVLVMELGFADGLLLFCRADMDSIEVLNRGLDRFAVWSGLRLNVQKNHLIISRSTQGLHEEMLEALGFQEGLLLLSVIEPLFGLNGYTMTGYETLPYGQSEIMEVHGVGGNSCVYGFFSVLWWTTKSEMGGSFTFGRTRGITSDLLFRYFHMDRGSLDLRSQVEENGSGRLSRISSAWRSHMYYPQSMEEMTGSYGDLIRVDPQHSLSTVYLIPQDRKFSRQCLTAIRRKVQFHWPNRDWVNDIEWASHRWRGKHIVNIAYRALLASFVYHIWRERNIRRFEQRERTPSTMALLIVDDVRQRIISISLASSRRETNLSVKKAVFDISEDKAPGPDGYSSGFFKAAWPVVGTEVTRAVLNFFTTGKLLKQVNSILLTLIPKLFGFPPTFTRWIEECISTTSFSIGLNGNPHGFFDGARGLRQGDPLSPFLFVLVMEVLHIGYLQLIEQDMQFTYHWKCELARVFQLGFADDLLLFCRADLDSVRVLKVGLDLFAEWSGLWLNTQKSHIIISRSAQERKDQLLLLLGFQEGHLPMRYLGLPLISSRLTISDCQPLLSKIDARIVGWEGMSLSYAGRVQIIKSVLSALSIYWASAFILPKAIIKEAEKRLRRFLWKGTSMTGYAKVAWKDVCKPIGEGGQGIKDIDALNRALMTKKLCDVIRCDRNVYLG